MNNKHIYYRPFQPSDYKPLEDIIRKTWGYDEFCSPKIAKRMRFRRVHGALVLLNRYWA